VFEDEAEDEEWEPEEEEGEEEEGALSMQLWQGLQPPSRNGTDTLSTLRQCPGSVGGAVRMDGCAPLPQLAPQ
jgi:hypothetical protein